MFSSRSKICGLIDGLLPIIGTMLIDSAPPAIITSASPTRMRSAAIASAVRPEAQKRLTVTPPTRVRQAGQQHADARDVQALLALRESRSRRWRLRSRFGSRPGTCATARLDRVHQQVVRAGVLEIAARRLADRRAGRGDDVCVLKLFAHVSPACAISCEPACRFAACP